MQCACAVVISHCGAFKTFRGLNGVNKEALTMCLRASLIMCMCCCMFSAFLYRYL